MPTGGNPPPTSLPSTVFSALHVMTYNPNSCCFVDANGNDIFLGVQDDGTGKEQWFYGTNSQIAIDPRAIIPSATASVILGGTYSNGYVIYQNVTYAIRFQRDTQGNHVASAISV